MSNPETLELDDFRILSDSITYLINKDYENALINVKKIYAKCDDIKSKIKLDHFNDHFKSKCSKMEEFRFYLMIVAAKLKPCLEYLDKYDHNQIISMLNYALILHFIQQNVYCTKILDKIQKFKSLMDDYTYVQFIYLRLENYLNIQAPDLVLKLADNECSCKEDNKFMNESDMISLDIFRLKAYIQNNNYTEVPKILEKIHNSEFSLVCRFIEGSYLYFMHKIPEVSLYLANLGKSIEMTFDKDHFNYWNNMGCLNFHMNKHNIGIMYFNRSLNSVVNSNKKSKSVVYSNQEFSFGRYYEIIHNLGIQLLFANKPIEAFDILLEVVNVYPKNPRLWFRLAECCVKAFRIGEGDIYTKATCVQNVIGSENYKKVIIGNETKECKKPWEEVAAMPTPTLEFGSLCIRNAMFLLPNHSHLYETTEGNVESIIKWYKDQCLYVSPGGCIRDLEIMHLRSSILLNGAYIALSLNNYTEAFRFSEKLLQQPILSPIHIYTARNYKSEALLLMNKLNDSSLLLNPNSITSISCTPEVNNLELNERSCRIIPLKLNGIPSTLEEAQSIMYFNLATVYAIMRQDKLLEQCISESLNLNPRIVKSTYYTNLIVYLELSRGKTKNCLNFLSETFSQIPTINNIEV